MATGGTTAEALGYGAEDRVLIINADDFGVCHSINRAISDLLEEKAVCSATVMMPCGWASDAVRRAAVRPEFDVGIHFTFTSEWDGYRWGPVGRRYPSSSLTGPDGLFPRDCRSFELAADPEEVRAEMIAQLEMALALGLEPTHADNHMGSLYGLAAGRHFLPIVLDVCAEFGLPFRLPRTVSGEDGQVAPAELAEQARQLAALADAKGVVILDHLVALPFQKLEGETYESFRGSMQQLLKRLRPGVSELFIHPSYVTEELLAFHGSPEKRGWETELFRDEAMKRTLAEEGVKLIGWRELQRLQRSR